MKNLYYLDKSGEVKGPFSSEEMTALHRSGQVSATTQVCEEGTEDWMPYYKRASFAPITKKKKNSGVPTAKFDHTKHEEIESETTEIKDKKGASYSLRIRKNEPIFHRFCRRGGWFAVGLGILCFFGFLYYNAMEMEAEASDALGLCGDLIWVVLVLFGSGQMIRFFHSIAFNTQEMRKEKGDE